jgi:hypothetical protein
MEEVLMVQSTLGKLPEGFTHLAQFRPADALDFSRRAKNLAKLMEAPLQAAQNILARAYGYADLHELQQVLKVEGPAGTYQDQLPTPADATTDLVANVRFYRNDRLMRCIVEAQEGLPVWEQYERNIFACDLGLFSSPTAHRQAVKSLNAFLSSGVGHTLDGFPFGFNGSLSGYYCLYSADVDETALKAMRASQGFPFREQFVFEPAEQLRILRRHRAAQIFVEMAERAPQMGVTGPRIRDYLDWGGSFEPVALLQHGFAFEIESYLIAGYEQSKTVELPENSEEVALLKHAVREPDDAAVQACALTRDIPDFRALLGQWRFSLRLDLARALIAGDFEHYFSDGGKPLVIHVGNAESRLFMLLQKNETYDDFQQYSLTATLLERTGKTETWSPAGFLRGDYVIPYHDGSYCGPENMLSYFDDAGEADLYKVWGILCRTYLPRAGYESYKEWVNDSDGSALADVAYWVPVGCGESTVLSKMLEYLVRAFEEGMLDSWDQNWKGFGCIEECVNGDDVDEEVFEFPPLSVVFVEMPKSGAFGYSIWDGDSERATAQLIRSGGTRLERPSRRHRAMNEARTGPAWDLLTAVKTIPADFIVFDPEEVVSPEE